MQKISNQSAQDLYLDIMKRCLTDSIFMDDPLSGFVPYRFKSYTAPWKRVAIAILQKILKKKKIELIEAYSQWGIEYTDLSLEEMRNIRENGRDWPVRAHTMIGWKRLNNLQFCCETAIREHIPGDFIETGVWRGGACILMRAVLKAYEVNDRTVWVADSFSGLPPPNLVDYPCDEGDIHYSYDSLAISKEEVMKNFERYGLLDNHVNFLQGWFKDTLPSAPISSLAVIRLDGDMYESTIQALESLYDKLSLGGFVIIDDYYLKPCFQAVHDFRDKLGIKDPIQDIDGLGSFWRRLE